MSNENNTFGGKYFPESNLDSDLGIMHTIKTLKLATSLI